MVQLLSGSGGTFFKPLKQYIKKAPAKRGFLKKY